MGGYAPVRKCGFLWAKIWKKGRSIIDANLVIPYISIIVILRSATWWVLTFEKIKF